MFFPPMTIKDRHCARVNTVHSFFVCVTAPPFVRLMAFRSQTKILLLNTDFCSSPSAASLVDSEEYETRSTAGLRQKCAIRRIFHFVPVGWIIFPTRAKQIFFLFL